MKLNEIAPRLDALVKAMSEKGLVKSDACLQFNAGQTELWVITKHQGPGQHWADKWDYHKGDALADAFAAADAWVAALPTPAERHRKEFLTLAGKAADYAAEHLPGDEIATEVRATIVAGMQRISENVLTDQRAM